MLNLKQPPLPPLDLIISAYEASGLDESCKVLSTTLVSFKKFRTTWISEYSLTHYNKEGQTIEEKLIGKIYSDQAKGVNSYRLLQYLWSHGMNTDPNFTIVRPIAYLHGWGLLLMSKAPGKTLDDWIHEGYEDKQAAFLIAKWLTRLHAIPLAGSQGIQPFRGESNMSHIFRELETALPDKKTKLRSLYNRFIVKFARRGSSMPVYLHGDFNTKNIFLNGQQITVIDFDHHIAGDPAWDVAYLVTQIQASAFFRTGDFHHFQSLIHPLIDTYLDAHPSFDRSSFYHRLSLYRIPSLIEILYYLLCVLKTGTYDIVDSFLQECEDSLKARRFR